MLYRCLDICKAYYSPFASVVNGGFLQFLRETKGFSHENDREPRSAAKKRIDEGCFFEYSMDMGAVSERLRQRIWMLRCTTQPSFSIFM